MKKSDLPFLERLYRFIFRKLYSHKVCVFNQKSDVLKQQRIVFYLNYPQAIHFGDTLWFEPVIRLFNDIYPRVYVYSSVAMSFYFRGLGYNIIEQEYQININDILITRTDLAYFLRKRKVLYLNFSYTNLRDKLINTILREINKYFVLSKEDAITKPQAPRISEAEKSDFLLKYNLFPGAQYIVFNDYTDSFDLQMNPQEFVVSRYALYDFVRQFKIKNPNYKIIYTGSERDLSNLPATPEFIDVDLRGKTSLRELFILGALSQTMHYIGYDTFLMHLFNLYDKNSYIKLRPGYSVSYNAQVIKYVAIPYGCAVNKIEFI